ncbi:MAG TPA: response regulator transcription factor [Candidatus Methylomirabilis sp.]|nr:response regulator transcription factor [Candidatus Methylomirabilis sp.]
MASEATVFVIDDEASVRKAVARLLRSAGHQVETLGSAEEFLRRPHYDGPGCLILDVKMPGQSGLELQQALARAGYHLPIIFVSGRSDISISVKAMKAGAVDFLTKPFQHTDLLRAVDVSLAKDQEARASRAEVQDIQQRLQTLTAREREVLSLVVSGRLNKQIAYELGISEKTVKVHRARVVEKMHSDSVADLVRLAEKVGISPAAGSPPQP